MDKKQLVEVLNRLVQKRVDAEMDRRYNEMRMQIISEVAGMLTYTERKILSEIHAAPVPVKTPVMDEPQATAERDFDAAMRNLRSMPGYRKIVDKVATPKRRYTDNPTLNEILSETTPLSRNEMGSGPMVTGGSSFDDGQMDFGFDQPSSFGMFNESSAPQQTNIGESLVPTVGTDNRTIDFTNPAVQKVLNILQNTNHKEKFEKIKEAGDEHRDMGLSPLVTVNDLQNNYFEKSMVK